MHDDGIEAPPNEMDIHDNSDSSPECDVDDENEWQTHDLFDSAFHKLVLRRLSWLCRRAADNEGKLDRKFLLGPRFWRKAIRRVKLCRRRNGSSGESSPPPPAAEARDANTKEPAGDGRKLDGYRRTNDPVKLQLRAECKLNCVLNKVRIIDSANGQDLLGPRFWRCTLKLSGIRRAEDLKSYLNDVDFSSLSSSFAAIRFVDGEPPASLDLPKNGLPDQTGEERVAEFAANSPVDGDGHQAPTNFLDGILNSELLHGAEKSDPASTGEGSVDEGSGRASDHSPSAGGSAPSANFDSILYESLTKPLNRCSNGTADESKAAEAMVDNGGVVSLLDGKKCDSKLSTRLTERYKLDTVRSDHDSKQTVVAEPAAPANAIDGKLILNMDNQGFQLLTQSLGDRALVANASNYVLLADETGAMQYMVNVPTGGAFANLQLIGDATGNGQLAYAIQLADGNGAAVATTDQFVPMQIQVDDGKLKTKNLTLGEEAANVDSRQEFLATKSANSSSHVGKELSDFLNLHYVEPGEKEDTNVAPV